MEQIPGLLGAAVLLPFFAFWLILVAGPQMKKAAAFLSVGAILGAALFSYASLFIWLSNHYPTSPHHTADREGELSAVQRLDIRKVALKAESEAQGEHAREGHGHSDHGHGHDKHGHDAHGHADHAPPPALSGKFSILSPIAKFGSSDDAIRIDATYFIDSLTIGMFCMVTLIASCIHFYAIGYMHDEESDVTDVEVKLSDGHQLVRPGRFYRFFQYLSLFCFSMLGLVLAGSIFQVFVFWELVGICSYFLIGFYVERKSASTAANKAFIVNRVGDFGMLIGLFALWSSLGTFNFSEVDGRPGLFEIVRPAANHHALIVPDGMIKADAKEEVARVAIAHRHAPQEFAAAWKERAGELRGEAANGGPNYGYWLLVVGGVGIFCGCVGKSAQFPLHTWLPDAMEGPTPVSALVHSATMVAAGVYLVGRFYPVFVPEVLLVIAIVGCITLFMAATIAMTATDIKRVLAYSTISQLGYMMLALGVGGWLAGLMHLITHAFFKSLLFMCSGSVIHAVHTNDMRQMGGLLRKMPVTAITMLIGCLAIAGVGVPFIIGFSGYYSKDRILEQAYTLYLTNGSAWSGVFFIAAAGGAAITAFYMFRMWYMTFVGEPRNADRYDHAHESPPVMFVPLVILSVFAISVAWTTNLAGYGLIAAAFFIVKGVQSGWFKRSAPAHGHDDHGHAHGHDAHGHDSHAHEVPHELAQHRDAHGHVDASHDPGHHKPVHGEHHSHGGHHESTESGVTWAWVGTMLVCSLLGGRVLEYVIPEANLSLANLLEQGRPAGTAADMTGSWIAWTWPNEHTAHEPANHDRIVVPVTLLATGTWIFGIGLATLMYGLGYLSPDEVRKTFSPAYRFLVNKWWFDELYDFVFVQPTMVLSRFISGIDRNWIDAFLNGLASTTVAFSRLWDSIADRSIIDGTVNLVAGWFYSLGLQLRVLQTGRLRQYVMFIVIGALAVFVLVSFFWNPAVASLK